MKLSGSGYENCLSKLKQVGAVDRYGNVNANGLQSVAGDLHVSTSALASKLSKKTGMSFEDALRHLNSGSDLSSIRNRRMRVLARILLMVMLGGMFVVPAYAQESLWKELTHKTDTLYQQGDLSQAITVAEEALRVAEKTFGSNHPKLATSLNNLAELYRFQDKYAQAEPLHKRAIGIREKTLGQDHPDVATSLDNLAKLYRAQEKYAQAEPLYKRALGIREKALGQDHPDVATVLENLSELYKMIGKQGKVKGLEERAKRIRSNFIQKAREMVEEARREKDYVASLQRVRQAISVLLRYAPSTKETADALALAGFIYQEMQLWDNALQYYAKALYVARAIGYQEIVPALLANMKYVSMMRNR